VGELLLFEARNAKNVGERKKLEQESWEAFCKGGKYKKVEINISQSNKL